MEQNDKKLTYRNKRLNGGINKSFDNYLEVSDHPIRYQDYMEIINAFFKFIMSLVFDGECVKLPYRCGSIQIRGRKVKPRIGEDGAIKGLAPDWPKTKALWERDPIAKATKKKVYFFNEATGGIKYVIYWIRKEVRMTNKSAYSLIFSRANKRAASKLMFGGKEYEVIR